MFHYTKEVSISAVEAVTKLEEALQKESFGVLWQLDLKEKLVSKGIDFDKEVFILEVCNPQEADKVLTENMLASYFLPCKITVLRENEQTKIGMVKPTKMMEMLPSDSLHHIAQDIENRLVHCIDQVK